MENVSIQGLKDLSYLSKSLEGSPTLEEGREAVTLSTFTDWDSTGTGTDSDTPLSPHFFPSFIVICYKDLIKIILTQFNAF